MPRSSNDGGTTPFEIRPRIGGFPTWGGMFRRGDPSQVPPNRFHSLLNVRLADGDVQNRPGLAHVSGTEEAACITGLVEVDADPDALSFFFCDSEIISDTQRYTSVTRFNEEETPKYRSYWPYFSIENVITKRTAAAGQGRTVQMFRGRQLALGDLNGVGYIWNMSLSSSGDDNRVDLALEFDPNEAANGNVTDMCVRNENSLSGTDVEVLYLSTDDGKILRWDGATLTVVHDMGAAERTRIICVEGTQLFAAAGTTGAVAYQPSPDAAWVDLAWPVGKSLNATWDLVEFQGLVLVSGPRLPAGSEQYVHGWSPASPAALSTVWTWQPVGGGSIKRAVVRANVWYALVTVGGSIYMARATSTGAPPTWTWSDLSIAAEDPDDIIGFFVLLGEALVFWVNGIREVDPDTGAITVIYGPLVKTVDFDNTPLETFVI